MEGKEVIVKKVKKVGHGGHHGGSWKVAYADFVTAMMAFFLLMWLVTAKKLQNKPEDLKAIETYFKEYNALKGEKDIKQKIDKVMQAVNIVADTKNIKSGEVIKLIDSGSEQGRQLLDAVRNEIQIRLSDVSDQVLVDTFDGAIRIQLVDKDGNPMFPAGSAELTPVAKKILAVIGEKIISSGVKIAIEGHTDAYSTSSSVKTNWEISTERASAARIELERDGLDPSRLLKVTGYADTMPLNAQDPYDPRNRRINILLYYTK